MSSPTVLTIRHLRFVNVVVRLDFPFLSGPSDMGVPEECPDGPPEQWLLFRIRLEMPAASVQRHLNSAFSRLLRRLQHSFDRPNFDGPVAGCNLARCLPFLLPLRIGMLGLHDHVLAVHEADCKQERMKITVGLATMLVVLYYSIIPILRRFHFRQSRRHSRLIENFE